MAAPLVELDGVCRRFALGGRAVAALEDVSLSLGQGDYVGIVGPSGSGKTSLMKIMGCLDLPDAGRYLLDGAEVTALGQDRLASIRNRSIGFVFQSFVLLPQSTALENVELPLAYAGTRRAERRERAREMLARVGLSHRLAHRPARLSGGEQQRVAIARAMVNRPKLLLADEPTGALDAASADGVLRLFAELNAGGVTVVVVTHDPAVAARAGRVLHLRDGRVERQEKDGGVRLSTTLLPALHALRVHRLRSGLAVLGISFGVMAVTLIVAFGAATQARLDAEIRALGSDVLYVLAVPARGRGAWRSGGTANTITDADADAIARDVPGVFAAAPAVRGGVQVVRGNRNRATALRGVTPAMFEARPWPIVSGRPLTDEDVRRTAKVVLLGHGVAAGLFPDEEPTGRVVRIGRAPFTVIGVMQEQGYTLGGDDLDDQVLVPLSTARKRVLGYFDGHPSAVGGITLRVAAGASMEEVGATVADLLRQRHRIAPGEPDDFVVRDLAAIKRAQARSDLLVTTMLAGAAAVSLLVGAIGIMNLMLVSVSERRQEIGLRMALGARRREIAMQFICEAGLLALLGSIAGAVVPLGIGSLVDAGLAVDRPETTWAVVAAVVTATIVTLVSALYPARRAASVLPAESLFR